jgi:hypothetical protein
MPGMPAARRTPFALVTPLVILALGCGGGDRERPPPVPPASVATLQSRPDLRPPVVALDTAPRDTGPNLIFVSPRMEDAERDGATHQQGALALDELGRTRWWRPAPDGAPITDVRVQRYRGRPVLTWWQGAAAEGGIGSGRGVIADEAYRTIATVRAGNRQTADLHEFALTDRGTAFLTIYSRSRRDLRAMGGLRDAQVTEGIVQEVDVATGRVLFEWHSLDHVDPAESFRRPTRDPDESFDYFHINSVEEDEDGDLLVSARHTSAVYAIDRETGDVRWRLGGRRSDFTLGEGAGFGLQHDARWLGDGSLQLFDNAPEATGGGAQEASSVKRLALDERAMTATLRDRFGQPDGMWAESQGNAQALDDGRVLAGWGSTGAFTLFRADGEVLFDAHLPAEYDSYRASTARWTGRPPTRPAIRVARDGEQVTVSASWNGATEVRAWQVLAGAGAGSLRPVGRPAAWRDLETTVVRASSAPVVAVAALDGSGATLATSPAVRAPRPGG